MTNHEVKIDRSEEELLIFQFINILRLLEDPLSWRNPKINQLVGFFRRLIFNGFVPVEVDWDSQDFRLDYEKDGLEEKFSFRLPPKLIKYHKTKKFDLYKTVVIFASNIRDIYYNQYQNSEAIVSRAQAYVAELLLKPNQIPPDYELTTGDEELIKKFPSGIDSLRPEDQYPCDWFVPLASLVL